MKGATRILDPSDAFRKARQDAGLSRLELARRTGMRESEIVKFELNYRRPQAHHWALLQRATAKRQRVAG